MAKRIGYRRNGVQRQASLWRSNDVKAASSTMKAKIVAKTYQRGERRRRAGYRENESEIGVALKAPGGETGGWRKHGAAERKKANGVAQQLKNNVYLSR